MTCQKLFVNFKNISNVLYWNTSLYTFNKNLKYNSTDHIVRPIFITFLRYCSNISSLETVKTTLDLNEFKRLNFSSPKYVAQTLQNLLNIPLNETKAILRIHPKLRRCSSVYIEKNYELCKNEGITDETLKRFPYILAIDDVNKRSQYIKQLSLDINKTAPLLAADIRILQKIVSSAFVERNQVPYGSRIAHLSKMLNSPEWEISEKLIKHEYILRIPFERLEKVLEVLLDYGVEPKNIMNDFWALRYSPELAERRLQRAINANVYKVKTWMIRCTDEVFERCINRQIENRKILGSDSSVEEYLSKRLECSIENAKYLTSKYPALEKMNISKMKEMLDFLFEQGYTPGHVCRVPRILIHSLETTKSRLKQLKQYGIVPSSLALLCKSKRDFDKYMKKYVKTNKSNIESENKKL